MKNPGKFYQKVNLWGRFQLAAWLSHDPMRQYAN